MEKKICFEMVNVLTSMLFGESGYWHKVYVKQLNWLCIILFEDQASLSVGLVQVWGTNVVRGRGLYFLGGVHFVSCRRNFKFWGDSALE